MPEQTREQQIAESQLQTWEALQARIEAMSSTPSNADSLLRLAEAMTIVADGQRQALKILESGQLHSIEGPIDGT
jgi:hypothetical protein